MNPNVETPSIRFLDNDKYEGLVSNIELELCPTKYEPNDDPKRRNDDKCGRLTEENNSIAAVKSRISEKISWAVRSYHMRVAMNERGSKSFLSVVKYTIGFSFCILPTVIFSLEMVPETCKICLDNVELTAYFAVTSLCGGVGATLLSNDFAEYFLAKFLGGTVGSLGALFITWMILREIPPTNALNIIFLSVGILGAMPGVVVYFLVKIASDECGGSDLQDFEDDFSSLTKLMLESEGSSRVLE